MQIIVGEAAMLDQPGTGVAGAQNAAAVSNPVDGFDALFRAHFAPMVRLAHLLGSDDPENAAQEAFSRLHGRMRLLQQPEKAVGYLRTCLVNLTRSRHAHLAIARRHRPGLEPDTTEGPTAAKADQIVVIAALRTLSPRHREALVLRYWLDLSEKQMAESMGVSVGSVKAHVSRGLSALRVALSPTESSTDGSP